MVGSEPLQEARLRSAMRGNGWQRACASAAKVILLTATLYSTPTNGQIAAVTPQAMPAIARVDQRYQSYNVEMAEVVGGKFWKPYAMLDAVVGRIASTTTTDQSAPPSTAPVIGESSAMFKARPPVDLSNMRLRKLAAALGPAYIRVSGTWANSVFFQDSDAPAPVTPPKGFQSVLTRSEWKGVINFAQAVNAKL